MKTAVEQLELSLLGLISFDSEELRAKYKERIAKAKELEKQQIVDAFIGQDSDTDENLEIAEQYYNETFKNK